MTSRMGLRRTFSTTCAGQLAKRSIKSLQQGGTVCGDDKALSSPRGDGCEEGVQLATAAVGSIVQGSVRDGRYQNDRAAVSPLRRLSESNTSTHDRPFRQQSSPSVSLPVRGAHVPMARVPARSAFRGTDGANPGRQGITTATVHISAYPAASRLLVEHGPACGPRLRPLQRIC